jgi:hypothetical protein
MHGWTHPRAIQRASASVYNDEKTRPNHRAPSGQSRDACYNPAPRMVGRDWVLLVTGTLLGVVSLTADLVGVGGFPGFGWKQAIGTAAALGLVVPSGWRIFRASRRDRP